MKEIQIYKLSDDNAKSIEKEIIKNKGYCIGINSHCICNMFLKDIEEAQNTNKKCIICDCGLYIARIK